MPTDRVLPNQIIMWDPDHVVRDPDPGVGQFLRCLKDTLPGDRQAVWEGRYGRGIVGVVDFGDFRRLARRGVYERWGTFTPLSPPIARERAIADPVLGLRLQGSGAKALQGNAIPLSPKEATAIETLAGGLPKWTPPTDQPGRRDEEVIDWATPENWPAEIVIEMAAATQRGVWRRLGFSERPRQQVAIGSGCRPDLLAPGTVGDAKRRVRATDGPPQLARYLDVLATQRPEDGPWRGVLLQHADSLDEAACEQLADLPYEIRVFEVWQSRARWHVESLFAKPAD